MSTLFNTCILKIHLSNSSAFDNSYTNLPEAVRMVEANATSDAFLSYNNRDHPMVEAIGRELQTRGLTVFLDRWYLVPGRPWPDHLEKVLSTCRAVAIFSRGA